jgi:hypothetical protein
VYLLARAHLTWGAQSNLTLGAQSNLTEGAQSNLRSAQSNLTEGAQSNLTEGAQSNLTEGAQSYLTAALRAGECVWNKGLLKKGLRAKYLHFYSVFALGKIFYLIFLGEQSTAVNRNRFYGIQRLNFTVVLPKAYQTFFLMCLTSVEDWVYTSNSPIFLFKYCYSATNLSLKIK